MNGLVTRQTLQGAAVWGLGVALALTLPGALWKSAQPPPFPFHALLPTALALGSLSLAAPLAVWAGGPFLATRRTLTLIEAPPDLLWAALVLALWPAAWGPPGMAGWTAAFLLAALPGEMRWLAQALPAETPFPAAWGGEAVRRARGLALARLWGPWLGARLPLWLTAALVIERLLGVPGLGTDWMDRIARRDRAGLTAWILVLAVLWLLSRPLEREPA